MSCESTDVIARSHLAVQDECRTICGCDNRLDWVDVAKGIGILSVIAGHMGVGAINRIVFPWHMPLFFILSGVFLSDKLDVRSFIRAKGKTLLRPFAYTALVLIAMEFLWGIKTGGLDASAFRRAGHTLVSGLLGSGSVSVFGFGPIGAIWFLQALFIALVINRMVLGKHRPWIVIMLLAIIGVMSSRIVWLPFNIQSGFLASLFVFLGVRFKRFILSSPSSLLCLVGALCLMVSLIVKPRNLCVVTCSGNFLFYCLSPLIVYFVFVVARGVDAIPLLRHMFIFFGRNSLTILCLHLIELNEVPWRKIILLCGNLGVIKFFVLKMIFVSTGVLALKWINSRFGFRKENARGAC